MGTLRMRRAWSAMIPALFVSTACSTFGSSSADGAAPEPVDAGVMPDGEVPDVDTGRDAAVLDAPVDAVAGPKRVFVTTKPYPADLGFDGFDKACQVEATDLGASTKWMAYVSGDDPARAALARLRQMAPSGGPWYTVADLPEPVATLTDLASGVIRNPIRRTATRALLDVNVWTGAPGTPGAVCTNWTTKSGTGTVGSSAHDDSRWAMDVISVRSCSSSQHLYCFEL